MIALGVIVRHEMPDRVLKRCPSEEDHSVQALSLDRAYKPLGEGVQIRRFWRQPNDLDALADESAAEGVGVLRVSIENQVSLAAKEAVLRVGEVPGDLHHPPIVGMGSDARDFHDTAGDVDEEQDVVRDQSSGRPDFNAEEIRRCQTIPVRFEKGRPRGVLVSLGRRLNAIFFEDWRSCRVRRRVPDWPARPGCGCIPKLGFQAPCAG